ncbi:MAG: hypothetical protein P4L16_00395 [Chlamydiales bacterium]|nr:hypothetical protein [Chlamydiales bacterium]
MKIAIIGSGYVGTKAALFWSQSHSVVITTRKKERIKELLQMGLTPLQHIPDDIESWLNLLPGLDAILLCMAPDSIDQYTSCYLNTAKALIAALKQASTHPYILYTSSTSVYQDSNGSLIDEASSLKNNSILVETEQILQEVDATILRIGEIYGPGRIVSDRLKKTDALPGDGSSITNLSHIEDIIGFLNFALKNRLKGIFNVCNDTHIDRKNFYKHLCDTCCIPEPTWDPSMPSSHSSNKIVSNEKIKTLGYKLIHPNYIYPLATAFSPCPNDTYLFHAWSHNLIKNSIPIYPVLQDVNTLNECATKALYPLTKLSFYAFGKVFNEYIMLPTGSALGFGCGPKIISKTPFKENALSQKRIAIPGKLTTAHLLLELFLPEPKEKIFCTYDEIFSLIESGSVDCGIIIHEQRFIYEQAGFTEIIDLGALWEEQFHLPLPLGCIAVKRLLGKDLIDNLNQYLYASILYAQENPAKSLSYILEHAQVKDPLIVQKHIDLYVGKETLKLSSDGLLAIHTLFSLAQEKGLLAKSSLPLM